MIVADVNLVTYLLVDGPYTAPSRDALRRDDLWIAPSLWRTEFINVMATSVRESMFSLDEAMVKVAAADALVVTSAQSLDDREIIALSVSSRIATYDCTFVWLARKLGLVLVTQDTKVLKRFSDVAISIRNFADGK